MSIVDVEVLYGLTDRVSLDLTLPFVWSSGGFEQGTAASHRFVTEKASGVGDIALGTDYWLSNPGTPGRFSGSVGLGIKAPTGSDSAKGVNYNLNPPAVQVIDEGWQVGSGGWYLLLRGQGTARLSGRLFAYASGFYGLSLTEHTDVKQGVAFRGVPDLYSARLGGAYRLPFAKAMVLTAGGRINGITVRDLIGGGDLYFRRPGYEIYFEPGLTWTRGANLVSLSVPLRVYQNKLDSLLDVSLNRHVGADFAPFLVIVGYGRRF